MKKVILPIVILALLVVLMSSGSFAIYTQTQSLRGELYMRVFLFSGDESSTSYEFGLGGLALSPGQGETELYRFSLTNVQNGNVCDYGMAVNIASSGMSGALSNMGGLTFYLYDLSAEGYGPVATVTSGELSYNGLSFTGGVSKTTDYKITDRWNDTGNSSSQTSLAASGARYPIKIIVSSQATN